MRIRTKLTSHRPPVWVSFTLFFPAFLFHFSINWPSVPSASIYPSAARPSFHRCECIHAAEGMGSPGQAGAQHRARFHHSILPVRGKRERLHLFVGRTQSRTPSIGSKCREGACTRSSALPKAYRKLQYFVLLGVRSSHRWIYKQRNTARRYRPDSSYLLGTHTKQ